MLNNDLLTTAEAAHVLKTPPATLRYWRHKEQGPPCFSIGRRVVYRATEIDRWLAEQETATRRGGTTANKTTG